MRSRVNRRFLVLLVLCAGILLALSGCGKEAAPDTPETTAPAELTEEVPVVTEARHYREEVYPADFSCMSLRGSRCSVSMEKRIYDESTLRDAYEALCADLAAFEAATGASPDPVEVFIVARTICGVEQLDGNRIFCPVNALNGKVYHNQLAQAAYGLDQFWQGVGIAHMVFEPAAADPAELREFYAHEEHTNILSLFPLYFMPDYVDAEDLAAAEQTAGCIVKALLAQGGMDGLRSVTASEAVNSWLEAMDIHAPVLPDGHENVECMAFRYSVEFGQEPYFMQADEELNHASFALNKTDWIDRADDYYKLICNYYAGRNMLLADAEALLPSNFAWIKTNADVPIYINLVNRSDGRMNEGEGTGVRFLLNDPGVENAVFQRTTHFLFCSGRIPATLYGGLICGLMTRFAARVESKYGTMNGTFFFRILTEPLDAWNEQDKITDAMREEQRLIIRCYTSKCPIPASPMDIDTEWLYRTFGIVRLLREADVEGSELIKGTYTTVAESHYYVWHYFAGDKSVDFNDFTYFEGMLFIDYLAEQFGLDAVAAGLEHFSVSEGFEEIYGLPYTQCYLDFYQWLTDHYGACVAD